jgi:tetratricopeptide (TPR) repeat protein
MKPHRLVLALLVLGASVAPAGCISEEPQPIDEHLMAALGQARALHHLADVQLAEGDTAEALTALERVVAIAFPEGAPERDDVVVDAYGRMAKIQLGAGRLDEAMATVERGLREGRERDTFYVAALHMVVGEIHEARAAAAREASDATTAGSAAREAIEAYERSIAVNQRVLDRLLAEGPVEATR